MKQCSDKHVVEFLKRPIDSFQVFLYTVVAEEVMNEKRSSRAFFETEVASFKR